MVLVAMSICSASPCRSRKKPNPLIPARSFSSLGDIKKRLWSIYRVVGRTVETRNHPCLLQRKDTNSGSIYTRVHQGCLEIIIYAFNCRFILLPSTDSQYVTWCHGALPSQEDNVHTVTSSEIQNEGNGVHCSESRTEH